MSKDNAVQIEELAKRCLDIARDSIVVNMRFFDVALMKLPYRVQNGLGGVATDGESFCYDARFILGAYRKDEHMIARMYLHSMLHVIFGHAYNYDRYDKRLWDLACDIAVENIIMELKLSDVTLKDDNLREGRLRGLKKNVRDLTAQKIYKHFLVNSLAREDEEEYRALFTRDMHIYFEKTENYEISNAQWQKISERIKAEIKSFAGKSGDNEALIKNLMEATKERVNYKDVLRRFVVMSEETTVNDDEFDYIYYTYGMNNYNNMPFIEPLEYKDAKKVKDFAIVIDTSASCKGSTIKKFMEITYNIMKEQENFFNHINVHLIQCDSEVRQDVKITSNDDFDEFIKNGKVRGFGGTDFRPAFEYVDDLIEKREFEQFKGLIYLTDGYGIFPEKAPDYDAMFVFINNEDTKLTIPWWVIKVEVDEDESL